MTDPIIRSSIDAGLRAHQSGAVADAIQHYESALAIDGRNALALSLYGLALLHAGRPDDARAPLEQAVELEPNNIDLQVNRAEFLRVVGEHDAAVQALKNALGAAPKHIRALNQLGEAYIAKREYAKAADALDEALQLAPSNLGLALRLARAHAASGHYPAAFYALEHADKIAPESPATIEVRLDIAKANNDWSALEDFAQKMIALAPEQARGWRELAVSFFERGFLRAAMEAFERVLDREGRTAENLIAYGRTALRAGRPDLAGPAFDEAEALGEGGAALHAAQSERYLAEGDHDRALSRANEAAALDPTRIDVYPHLSLLRKGMLKGPELEWLEAQAVQAEAPFVRATAGFVIGRHYDASDDVERAFAAYARANEATQAELDLSRTQYDPAGRDAQVESILARFADAADFEAAGAEDDDPDQAGSIFIVGAPRSGTTLLEAVLAAHSKVCAGGELPALPTLLHYYLERGDFAGALSSLERSKYLGAYWKQAPDHQGAAFLTDKSLGNVDAMGLIAQMFPAAPIIRIRRNPVETGFSIWRNQFTRHWAFNNDFGKIAHYLASVERLANHWSAMLGGRVTTIQYEDFVQDHENQAKALIAACGLDWEASCLEPARPGTATLSAAQVREPVELKGRAAAYGARLDPLRRALEENGVNLETGALGG